MRIYLCARYSRNEEMRYVAQRITELGHEVLRSEWITGAHHDTPDQQCAEIDWQEVRDADVVISFTEPPGEIAGRGRGGRHVEFGMALAYRKRCIVVGYRENVFHHLPLVEFCPKFSDLLSALSPAKEK